MRAIKKGFIGSMIHQEGYSGGRTPGRKDTARNRLKQIRRVRGITRKGAVHECLPQIWEHDELFTGNVTMS